MEPKITAKDIQKMEQLFFRGHRSEMYHFYADITGSTQARIQAKISTLQGTYGRLALEANRRSRDKIIEDLGHGWYPKEGIESFSYDISLDFLNKVKESYKAGKGGILSDHEIEDAAKQVWVRKGIGEYFPGDIMNAVYSEGSSSSIRAIGDLFRFWEERGLLPSIADNDDNFTAPLDRIDPAADNPPIISGGSGTTEPGGSSGADTLQSSGGFFASAGSFLSGIGDGVSGFFEGLFGNADGVNPFTPVNRTYRSMKRAGVDPVHLLEFQAMNRRGRQTIDPEKLLGEVFEKNADRVIDKLIGRNPNLFEKTLGRALATSLDTFAGAIRNSRTRGFEEAISNAFSGKGGQQFATNIGNMAAQEIVNYGINEIFYKERTRVREQESERSRNAHQDFRLSRSQQGAELIRLMEKGKRNL